MLILGSALVVITIMLWLLHDPHGHDMDYQARDIEAAYAERERRHDHEERARRRDKARARAEQARQERARAQHTGTAKPRRAVPAPRRGSAIPTARAATSF